MASPDDTLIADRYEVDTNRKLPPVGGLAAFGAIDRVSGRADLMAVQLNRQWPARPRAFQALAMPIDGLLTPLTYGSAGNIGYAISLVPPGPTVQSRSRPWPEAELLERVLRPIAHVLAQLQARGITHRGIRLDNVFQSAPGQSVVLGNAWEAPAAMAQPGLFEPPYSAMCLPAGRGDGSIADDVYSLGVLLLCLALGHTPLSQYDDATILRRKLELGTYAALASDERLPPVIADLARGMLAEDPEHRPTPTLLLDPANARGRRVAARPPRPIAVAGSDVWDARSLAYALAANPEQGINALRSNAVEHWLRRGLGDAQLATRVEELVRHRSLDLSSDDDNGEAGLAMRAIAVLDPLAPLCWRGVALWPDAIGTALAVAQGNDPDVVLRLEEIVTREEAGNWAVRRPDRCDFAMLRVEARQQHSWLLQRGPGGLRRLVYLLNPLMPCASSLLGGQWVARLPELLPALEATAAHLDRQQSEPVDTEMAAFISARLERRMEKEMAAQVGGDSPSASCLAQLRVLARRPCWGQGRGRCWPPGETVSVARAWRSSCRFSFRLAIWRRCCRLSTILSRAAPMRTKPTRRCGSWREPTFNWRRSRAVGQPGQRWRRDSGRRLPSDLG